MRGIEVLWLEILWGTRRLECEKYTPRGKHRTEVTEGDWVLFSFSPTRPHRRPADTFCRSPIRVPKGPTSRR
jgi:hypothetical protein